LTFPPWLPSIFFKINVLSESLDDSLEKCKLVSFSSTRSSSSKSATSFACSTSWQLAKMNREMKNRRNIVQTLIQMDNNINVSIIEISLHRCSIYSNRKTNIVFKIFLFWQPYYEILFDFIIWIYKIFNRFFVKFRAW